MQTFTERRQAAFRRVENLACGLPVLLGTGYPVEAPHCVLIDRHFALHLTVWPCGDNGLTGIGRGRPYSYHVIEV